MFCLLFTSKPRSRASLHIWTVRMLDISSGNVGSLDLALIDASKHSREHAAKLEMFLSKCGDMWNENISGRKRTDVTALSKTNLQILHRPFTHASKTKRKNGLKFSTHIANTPRQSQEKMAIEANATNAIWRKIV
ncbi:unnamed protein product [Bathycoccus prasinos]